MTSLLFRNAFHFGRKVRSCNRICVANFYESNSTKESENVFVVHPKIRWGRHSRRKSTTSELQLEEAATLCKTLPYFNVAGSVIVGTDQTAKSRLIWGDGRLEQLMLKKQELNATSLMINVDQLSPLQQAELSSYFGVPVYDRYNVVLAIFKLYAKTKEARLQIALAELPYIRHRIKYLAKNMNAVAPGVLHVEEAAESLSRSGTDPFETLRLRQHSLRKSIKAVLEDKSAELKESQSRDRVHAGNIVVAVVGYTNAGKTSLLQRLTDSKTLFGEDRLFATLDTTIHPAILPSKIRLFLADTIGFISDLPISLFASFKATLQHVENADLLLHIHDMSHPDVIAQKEIVLETLEELNIRPSLMDSMIYVGNKIDKLPDEIFVNGERNRRNEIMSYISCETGQGLKELIQRIDLAVQTITGSRLRRFRLDPGSQAIPYLYENDLVSVEPQLSECGNLLIFDVIMTDAQMARFQAKVGNFKSTKVLKS